ncbi:MAG: hypothetical protein LJE70_05355 [Chromatiaceae bacterium]|nr:hypothetical protein [Chromatiaceae bacterium]
MRGIAPVAGGRPALLHPERPSGGHGAPTEVAVSRNGEPFKADIAGGDSPAQAPAPIPLRSGQYLHALQQQFDSLGVDPGIVSDLQASADGTEIVFATTAALVPDDDNNQSDVYRYRSDKGRLYLLSRAWDGGTANGASDQPRIDGWGEYVVFRSAADNLTDRPDANQVDDIYLADLLGGITERISWAESGEETGTPSAHPDLSGEELVVVYDREDATGQHGIYADDRTAVLAQRQDPGDCDARHPALSANARLLAYVCGEPGDLDCSVRFIERKSGIFTAAECPNAIEDNYRTYFDALGDRLIFAPIDPQ